MPRAPANPPHIIYEALKDLRFTDEKGILLPWSDDIWQIATDAMNGKMTKAYLYLYLSQNRNGIYNRIHGIEIAESVKYDSNVEDTADYSRQDPNWSMGETECALPALRKDINVSRSEWDALKSRVVEYKEREYEVLVVGWADAVYDILWTHMKLPCPFSFKNAKINRNSGEMFLSVKGFCSECGSKIHIYCLNEPADDGTTLHVSTFDSRGVAHQKKRQVCGQRRLRIGKELQGKSTYAWRREEALRLMDFDDVIPANIPSEEVIRKAKQEARDKDLGLFKVKSALASVWDMKYGLEFNGCIHEIGLDKFYLMYWTPAQLYMYNKFMKENCIKSISIDATGSLVKQIPKPDGSKRVVYLYQAVCGYRQKILPLFQLISEKHDTNTLTYWIREWLRSAGPCPEQVVTDYSLALLNATSLAFNNTDLKTYIETCIVFDTNGSSVRVNPPRCKIRLDISHFVNMVARWSCFNYENPEKKDFYLRCVGLLTTCTEINDFIRLCTDVLTIAFATHEDIDDKQSHCFAAQNRVLERLKSYSLPDSTNKLDDGQDKNEGLMERFNDVDEETELNSSAAIEAILKKIESDSRSDLKHGRLNPYQCCAFGSRLLKLAKQFVLWTAVMAVDDPNSSTLAELSNVNDVRLVSSSARSEEYFRELKHLVFKKEKSIRMDKFLVIHLRNLAGTTILLNADTNKNKRIRPKVTHSAPRIAEPVEHKSTILATESLTSTIENIFLEENLNLSIPHELKQERASECHLDREFDHGNDSKSKGGYNFDRKRVCEDDDDGKSEHDLEQKQETLDGTSLMNSLDDIPTEPEQSAMAFLNETEDWRGLTKKTVPIQPKMQGRPKKRGKYLTPCPDIQIVHQRPKFSLTLPLLVNGNGLGPAKIGKQIIAVRNTCAFDSTVQSMLAAYHDFAPYHEHITKSKIALHNFVETLSKSGVSSKLYNERGEILKHTKDIKNEVLDCEINVGTLIESHILPNTPSLEIKINCSDCQVEKIITIPVLDLNPDPIFKEAMRGLQETVTQSADYYVSKTRNECFFCKGPNIYKIFNGGSHIFLNIEAAEIGLIAARRGLSNCRKQFTLLEIPEKLCYCDCQYKLVSAIIYVAGHYYSCIKRASGTWEEHNDLCSSRRVMAITNREVLKQRRIHLLFYVRI